MRIKHLSATFLFVVMSASALVPVMFGISILSVVGAAALVLGSTFLVEPGRARNRMAFGQLGAVGTVNVAEEYRRVQGELRELDTDLRSYHESTQRGIQEMDSRLAAVEQTVVSLPAGGGSAAVFRGGVSLAVRAVEQARDDASFAHIAKWNQGTARIELQAGIRAALTNDGMGTSNDTSYPGRANRGPIVTGPDRDLRLLDYLPSRPVSESSTEYVQMHADADAAEQVVEGDEKQYIDMEGILKRANIATIAGWTSASKQVLSDESAMQNVIDRVLRYKCSARLEHQIINGPGGDGRINGLLNQATTFVPTIGTSPADIIGESMVRQANNGYMPMLVVMNPLDWFRLQIEKTNTEGEYLFGSPTMPVPPALWNAAVVPTPSLAEGTALTIDTSFVTVTDREKVSVVVSTSHADFFTRNLVAILGELRAGLEVHDTFAVYEMDISGSGG